MTVEHLRHLRSRLKLTTNHDHAVLWAVSLVGFWGLARRREMVGPTVKAITNRPWDPICIGDVIPRDTRFGLSYSIYVRHPKVNTAHNQYINLHPRPDDLDPISALQCILDWHDAQAHDQQTPLWLLTSMEEATPEWLRALWLAATNFDVGTSSFRAGGVTRLLYEGVALDTIKMIGRWRSDAFDDYVRS
ncbi:uncharacterized protein EV422DRAFT_487259, partial [Fimicolochytrium jonesii]|uniref:uncharacterized protein n=1 Tax=Fimicolochytrium jonesii TaxID=1396493 RepID=UPI0022FE071C